MIENKSLAARGAAWSSRELVNLFCGGNDDFLPIPPFQRTVLWKLDPSLARERPKTMFGDAHKVKHTSRIVIGG